MSWDVDRCNPLLQMYDTVRPRSRVSSRSMAKAPCCEYGVRMSLARKTRSTLPVVAGTEPNERRFGNAGPFVMSPVTLPLRLTDFELLPLRLVNLLRRGPG